MPIDPPILAEAQMPDEKGDLITNTKVQVCGGLHQTEDGALPVFSIFHRILAGDLIIAQGAKLPAWALDMFPEFEDLCGLCYLGADGAPLDVLDQGWRQLGFTGTLAYRPEAVAAHFRIMPQEADLLYNEIMTVLNVVVGINGEPVLEAGRNHLKDWIEEQRPRWLADATSVILAHDLKVFGRVT